MRILSEKTISRNALVELVAAWRREGKKVGFTSGTFDLLHVGHVSYLQEAKKECDILIVGVNTDTSVKKYKDPNRPIVSEISRMAVVAALESVDYVFLFEEENNRINLEELKPSLYIKGGDRAMSQLTSSEVVTRYGGRTILIPKKEGFSTTALIERISDIYREGIYGLREKASDAQDTNDVVFVDRDGVINEDIEYLHEPEKFKLLPYAGEGLKKFQEMGYKICILTLQAGIGLGYFTKEDFFKVNREMFRQLRPYQITIDKIYFASTSKIEDGKNPKETLIKRAYKELGLATGKCLVIGDKTADIAAGKPFINCITIGMQTGKGLSDKEYEVVPDYVAKNLLDAARWVEQKQQASGHL